MVPNNEMEKRKATRIKRSLVIQFTKDLTMAQNWGISSAKDISESGVALISDIPLGAGDEIILRMKVPLRPFDWMIIRAKVIGCDRYTKESFTIRAAFVDINQENKDLLAQYIKSYLKQAGK